MKVIEILTEDISPIEAIDLLESKCSDMFKHALNSNSKMLAMEGIKGVLFRGISHDVDSAVFLPKRQRKNSLSGNNFLFGLTPLLKSWQSIPPRNASYLATPNFSHAYVFGEVHCVFPVNGKVGYTANEDFNEFDMENANYKTDDETLEFIKNFEEVVYGVLIYFGNGKKPHYRINADILRAEAYAQKASPEDIDKIAEMQGWNETQIKIAHAITKRQTIQQLEDIITPEQFGVEVRMTSDPEEVLEGGEVWFEEGVLVNQAFFKKILRIVS